MSGEDDWAMWSLNMGLITQKYLQEFKERSEKEVQDRRKLMEEPKHLRKLLEIFGCIRKKASDEAGGKHSA